MASRDVRGDAHQLQTAHPPAGRLTGVGLQQAGVLPAVKAVMTGEIGQVEVHVPHAGVFPIQDANGTVVQKVGVEQIVVARPRLAARQVRLDLVQRRLQRVEPRREGGPQSPRRHGIVAHDLEGRKRPRDGRQPVYLLQRLHDAPDRLRAADFLLVDRAALNKARHQVALRTQEVDNLGRDSDGGGRLRGGALRLAVDPQQLGALTGQAQHIRLAVRVHPEVAVGDAASQRRDPQVGIVGPARDPGDDLV